MTFNDILTEFRQSITQKEKGTKFERLMRSWLLTDPRFNQLQTVWMWEDFPAKNEISMFGDVGIDLVARTELGEYWAIQCKCYAETAQINKGDVDTFLSTSSKTFICPFTHTKMAFSNRLWISTTNNWGKNAEDAIANQTIPVSRINLYDLEISPVNWDELYNGQEGTNHGMRYGQDLHLAPHCGGFVRPERSHPVPCSLYLASRSNAQRVVV